MSQFIFFLSYSFLMVGLEWACAIIGLRTIRKSWTRAFRLLVALCCVTALVETSSYILLFMRLSNGPLYNTWGYVETAAILYIQLLLVSNIWLKRLLVVMLVVLTLGTAIGYIEIPLFIQMNFPVLLFSLFVQLIGACAALIDVLLNNSDKPLSGRPEFWFGAGMLFYSCVFIGGHIMKVFVKAEHWMSYTLFIIVANVFMYGGIIACFRTLRRQDRA